jgi:hypothetical protein
MTYRHQHTIRWEWHKKYVCFMLRGARRDVAIVQ